MAIASADAPSRTLVEWTREAMRGPRPQLGGAGCAHLCDLPGEALREVAAVHRTGPWMSAALSGADCRGCAEKLAPLHHAAMEATLRTLVQFHELTQILERCAARGIEVIVLKGPAIAERYYPEPGLRPYGDVDLLVHESDEAAMTALVLERGFEVHTSEADEHLHEDHSRFQQIYWRSDGCTVEIHYDHLQIGLRPAEMDEVWSRAVRVEYGGQPALTIEPNDLFVHLCVHLQRHGYERLIWFKDLDLMIRSGELDWSAIRERAEREGCLSVLAYTLSLLPDMLETPLPAEAKSICGSRSWFARTVQGVIWPRDDILALRPHRQWRFRRLTQFAPEHGMRGGLPSILSWGRRDVKTRVLLATLSRRLRLQRPASGHEDHPH